MGPKHCKIFYFPTGSPTTIEDKTFNFKPRGNFISVVYKVHIHCITQYYANQGIFRKPGKTSKYRPIHSTI